jgi:ankyrin repeat protein
LDPKIALSIDYCNFLGKTAVHESMEKFSSCSTELISRGANINAKDRIGFIPLHHACFSGSTEHVRVLLEGGADVTIKDSKVNTNNMNHSGKKKERKRKRKRFANI